MFTTLDRMLCAADEALRTLGGATRPSRPSPAEQVVEANLSDAERRHVAGLLRVDHAGEVCAQALYAGQALAARHPAVRKALQHAGREERDHLSWCADRLGQLGASPSALSPLWYAGSFALGVASGLAGDRWSLGFLVETERQVERHLDGHLEQLPVGDQRSRAVLEQMREEEIRHAQSGRDLGGHELPAPMRRAMATVAKVMTTTSYRF
jgi:ubiquinone biosynthesis monooxygenase Coq7